MRSVLVTVGLSLAWGCGGGGDPSGTGGGGSGGSASTGGGGGSAPDIAWSACPLYVDQPDGPKAECASIDVPLRSGGEDGPTIGIFVQRLRGTQQPARGQLWLLEGGPGASGADFDAWMEEFQALDPSLDLYAVDHRGVGRSARLACPVQETESSDWGTSVSPAEATACRDAVTAEWGADLAEFTSTAAARDLARVIERAKVPDQDIFVYGVSYGTYWAHRYLQIAPDQATAVVLDSIAAPGDDFARYDDDFNAVAEDFMDVCAADTLCASKLGADPWAKVADLSTALVGGHCPVLTQTWGLDAETIRLVYALLLMDPVLRTYLPALVYRYSRCDAADVAAIDSMLTILFGGPSTTSYYDTLSSDALFYLVALSELWPDPEAHPTLEAIASAEAALHVSTSLSPRVAAVQDIWTPYPDDAYVDAWAKTGMPLLMLNGDLDPMTPIWLAEAAATHFTGDHQTFLSIPRAAHAATGTTPVANVGDTPCALTIMIDFLVDPKKAPDTTCLASIPEESFTGVPGNNLYLLGTTDLWENAATATGDVIPHAKTPAPAHIERALARAKHILKDRWSKRPTRKTH